MMVCTKAEYHPVRTQPLSTIHHTGAANDTNTHTGTERARGAGREKKGENGDRSRGRGEREPGKKRPLGSKETKNKKNFAVITVLRVILDTDPCHVNKALLNLHLGERGRREGRKGGGGVRRESW